MARAYPPTRHLQRSSGARLRDGSPRQPRDERYGRQQHGGALGPKWGAAKRVACRVPNLADRHRRHGRATVARDADVPAS